MFLYTFLHCQIFSNSLKCLSHGVIAFLPLSVSFYRTNNDGRFILWQVVVCGILLVVMAVGNFVNTVEILMAKSRFKAKIKRSRSKQELTNGSTNNLRSLKSL